MFYVRMTILPPDTPADTIEKLWSSWNKHVEPSDNFLREAFEAGYIHGTRSRLKFKRVSLTFDDPKRVREHIEAHVLRKPNGCWEWIRGRNGSGYGIIEVDGRQYGVHRVSAVVFKGMEVNAKLDVCHDCDNPPCCNPDHLTPETRKYNIRDSVRKGRFTMERPRKLSKDIVRSMRKLSSMGIGTPTIGKLYGVTQPCVWSIIQRISWKSVPSEKLPSFFSWSRSRSPGNPKLEVRHGHWKQYEKGCHCKLCFRASAIRKKLRKLHVTRETIKEPFKAIPKSVRSWSHGAYAYKNNRCKCGLCRKAFSIRTKLRKLRVTKETLFR